MKKSFKIWGRNGHRQAVSFGEGYSFTDWAGVHTIWNLQNVYGVER